MTNIYRRFNYSMLLTKKANKVSSSEHFEKALEIFEECIQFRKRHYGWRHPLVAQNWQEKVRKFLIVF